MRQLLDHGANLDEPPHVVHFSIFTSQDGALDASRELSTHGWTSEPAMPLPAYPGQWSVKSERAGVVVALIFVRDSTAVLEAIAARHGGEYDGWEASASAGHSPPGTRIAVDGSVNAVSLGSCTSRAPGAFSKLACSKMKRWRPSSRLDVG